MTTIEEIRKIKKGDILDTSHGYDMTINNFCEVIENTGKTIKCQMIGKKVTSRKQGLIETAIPDRTRKFCEPIRIRISRGKPNINDPKGEVVYLVGSHPYAMSKNSANCTEKRRGVWFKWDGKPNYENTYD